MNNRKMLYIRFFFLMENALGSLLILLVQSSLVDMITPEIVKCLKKYIYQYFWNINHYLCSFIKEQTFLPTSVHEYLVLDGVHKFKEIFTFGEIRLDFTLLLTTLPCSDIRYINQIEQIHRWFWPWGNKRILGKLLFYSATVSSHSNIIIDSIACLFARLALVALHSW